MNFFFQFFVNFSLFSLRLLEEAIIILSSITDVRWLDYDPIYHGSTDHPTLSICRVYQLAVRRSNKSMVISFWREASFLRHKVPICDQGHSYMQVILLCMVSWKWIIISCEIWWEIIPAMYRLLQHYHNTLLQGNAYL